MLQRAQLARSILGLAFVSLTLGAGAQTETSGTTRAVGSPTNILSPGGGQIDRAMLEREQRMAQLRRQLADPVQRTRIRAERLQRVRTDHPDLARVMRLDATAEARLLELLTDQKLALELRPNGFADVGFNPTERRISPEALDHTARMREISQRLGMNVLDGYVDYLGTARQRQLVEQLNSSLPASNQLNSQQKDRFVAVLLEWEEQREQRDLSPSLTGTVQDFLESFNQPPAERERRDRIRNIVLNETAARRLQEDHRELLQRLSGVLTPAQSAVFAAQQRQQVDDLLGWTQQQRREAGIDLQQPLADPESPPPPPPALTGNVQLTLEIAINETKLVETLTSARGAAVSFAGPDGLLLQARPYLLSEDALMVELSFFESVDNRRRLIGKGSGSAVVTNPRRPSPIGGGHSGTLLLGRKGYDVMVSAKATYL